MISAPAARTIGPFLGRTRTAYFSMEVALRPEMHTYSGGLGVLAGDTARSCADQELPVVFVTLISREGYLRQEIDEAGNQVESPDPWKPAAYATPLRAKVAVIAHGREIWIRPWLHILQSALGHRTPVLLLDTDLDENAPEDRRITDNLYGGDDAYRFMQEVVLGIGGLRVLQALGFTIRTFHMNEGHAALLALDLLRRFARPADQTHAGELRYDVARVREMCIFTTHTPVEAGHDRFPYGLVATALGDYMDIEQIKLIAGRDNLNMTLLALKLSGYVNGVAVRHAETTKNMFPGYGIRAITNGIHPQTWAHPDFERLFDQHFPSWQFEPEILTRADQLDDDAIWAAHQQARSDLVSLVAARTGKQMSVDVPIIGFARRMTAYKRPDLLFADLERLAAICQHHPFQVVMAGKAHPKDHHGKELIKQIHEHMHALRERVRIAYLPGYDMEMAKTLVAGADVWLNTPVPPMEASGTSGMKAALNGGLNLSVLDGWWLEACIDGTTGWAIGLADGQGSASASAQDLYEKLGNVVLPLYHQDRKRWIWMMKQAISKIASYFNTQRMMRRYATEAYFR
jgi:glycogen phosphorylase